jgi:CRP/FNR family transcriptional regulator
MNEEELFTFANYFRTRLYLSSTRIFNEGESGQEFFIIVSGEVIVTVNEQTENGDDNKKNETLLCTKKKGDFFGELAILQQNHIRNTNVTTTTDCKMLVITFKQFNYYLAVVSEQTNWLDFFFIYIGTSMYCYLYGTIFFVF